MRFFRLTFITGKITLIFKGKIDGKNELASMEIKGTGARNG